MSTKSSLNTGSIPKDPSIFYQLYDNYKPIKKGGFGTVFAANEKYSRRQVAIKRVRIRIGTEEEVLEELKILSELEHPNILRYYNSWIEPVEYHKGRDEPLFSQTDISLSLKSSAANTSSQLGRTCDDDISMERPLTNSSVNVDIIFESSSEKKPIQNVSLASNNYTTSSQNDQSKEEQIFKPHEYLFIVTSLCQKESLQDRLLPEYRLQNPINRFEALYIFYQIVTGVRYIHNTKNTIHCDLKPANILFSLADDAVKIADFGLSVTQKAALPIEEDLEPNKNKPIGGTIFYKPIDFEPISFKRDIYALGIILFELLYPVSTGIERKKLLEKLQKEDVEFPTDFEAKYGSPILKSLICQLISRNPNERPTINQLHQLIRRRLETDDFEEDDTMVSKLEHVLNNPPMKQISLTTDEIQYGKYDTSDRYILLSDDSRLKLYNIDGELIDEFTGLHEHSRVVGYVQRIVWCDYLRQFLILCNKFLYAFAPQSNNDLTKMKKIHFIDRYRGEDQLRSITCSNKNIFVCYSYNTIRRYDVPQWFLSCEWSKKRLCYEETDQIRRLTCSRTNDYLAFNVCLDKCQHIIDLRRIDDSLSLLKRIQIPNLELKHKLQLSCREWLISTGKSHFSVLDVWEDEVKLKTVQTNIKSESDVYPRFFDSYLIVPIIRQQENTELNEDDSIQNKGFLDFYKWK